LPRHHLADRAVLDRGELACGHLPGPRLRARRDQLGRPEKASHLVGAEGRGGIHRSSIGHTLSSPDALPCGAMDVPRSISREDLAELPIRRYEGRMCVVATPEDLEEARADLAA